MRQVSLNRGLRIFLDVTKYLGLIAGCPDPSRSFFLDSQLFDRATTQPDPSPSASMSPHATRGDTLRLCGAGPCQELLPFRSPPAAGSLLNVTTPTVATPVVHDLTLSPLEGRASGKDF